MTRRTLGWLWSRYLEARDALDNGDISVTERRNAERELRDLRDRLVVNYSPLVRYVACRVSAHAIRDPSTSRTSSPGASSGCCKPSRPTTRDAAPSTSRTRSPRYGGPS